MFIDFFHQLRKEGIPVSLTEWLTLTEALAKGFAFSSMSGFYYLARAVLVKSEAHFDHYDLAFAKYFSGLESPDAILEEALDWLKTAPPLPRDELPRWRSPFAQWDMDELKQLLEERLNQQKEEANKKKEGGPHWIGTGGTSPFGHSGASAAGIRIGGGPLSMSAVKVAGKRRYRELRDDNITGVRQFEVALRTLRRLSTRTEGPKDELDLDGTIDATCRRAGMLQLVWERPRRNLMKVILLMDSGGSMDRFAQLCSRLFTAVHRATHFKDLKFYYFHNCVYDNVYTDHRLTKPVNTEQLFKTLNSDYRLIITGDASMAPIELTRPGGIIEWGIDNELPGIEWLQRLAKHYPSSVWVNPTPTANWGHYESIALVKKVFPMFELSPDGLEAAVKKLKTKK